MRVSAAVENAAGQSIGARVLSQNEPDSILIEHTVQLSFPFFAGALVVAGGYRCRIGALGRVGLLLHVSLLHGWGWECTPGKDKC